MVKSRPFGFSTLTLLTILAAPARAQETPAPSPSEEAAAIQPQFDQAKALVEAQDYAAAAALFEQIAAEHPTHIKGQKAAVRAAINWFWAGQTDKALQRFDAAAAMGLAPPVTQEALYEKARFCEKAGRPQDALTAIGHLSMGHPESDLLLPALDVKGRILGKTPEQMEVVRTRESQARELLATARQKLRIKEARPEVLGLIERIERDYADTAAAVAAMEVKAEALHIRGRIEEAQAVYQRLADRLTPVAPDAPLTRRAKIRVPYEMLHRAVQLCEEAIADGAKDAAKVEAAREQCRRVLAMPDSDPKIAAHARGLWVEIELLDNQPQRAQALAEEFLTTHYHRPSDLYEYGPWVLVMHRCIAEAADMQGNYDKALQKYQQIKLFFDQIPEKERERLRLLMQRVYLEHVATLIHARMDRSMAVAAARELIKRFPASPSADDARRRLNLTAEEATPEP